MSPKAERFVAEYLIDADWALRGGCAMDERFMVKIPWGVFGPGGFWAPNPLVKLPETEQYRQNIAAGYNIAAECIPDQLRGGSSDE